MEDFFKDGMNNDPSTLKGRSLNFAVLFHFHQPVDNFDWVFEDVYHKCYRPLIDQVEAHRSVKFNLHFTGSLLEWYLNHEPYTDLIDSVGRLVKRGQVEILGGGYYEPIFAMIPREDKLRQIAMLSDFVRETFGYEVNGAWLSERVWEPHYPSFLAEAGLTYVVVDDNHLRACGLREADAMYAYVTEDEGSAVMVFPINEPLRYLAPWQPAWKVPSYLRGVATAEGDRIIVFMSDAEKMGVWGTTHELCYERGHPGDDEVPYVKALFDHLEWNLKNQEWLKSVTLSEYQRGHQARGLVYLPNSTYDRMEEWALPTPSRRVREALRKKLEGLAGEGNAHHPAAGGVGGGDLASHAGDLLYFLKGGFWRYFLVKYPEVNNMHKKMLWVREKLVALRDAAGAQDPLVQEAWRHVLASQANDCYWHGQFGGVYYAVFRNSVYHHLLLAENLLDEAAEGVGLGADARWSHPRVHSTDFFRDGKKELLVETPRFNFYFSPADGGVIFELDYRPAAVNVTNVMSRWEEAYHEAGRVVVDAHRKSFGRVHVVPRGLLLGKYAKERPAEFGLYAGGPHQLTFQRSETSVVVTSIRRDRVTANGETFELEVSRVLHHQLDTDEFDVKLGARLGPGGARSQVYGMELAVDFPFFLSGDPARTRYELGDISRSHAPFAKFCGGKARFVDGERGFEATVDWTEIEGREQAWFYPIKTFSRMNERYERTLQGTNLVVRVPVREVLDSPGTITWRFSQA
ncbi:MAG: hypothetical protein Kow0069_37950 [Promethearchaeota archaeon]